MKNNTMIKNILTELDSIGYSKINGLLTKREVKKAKDLVNYH
jgi:hypothetical protein